MTSQDIATRGAETPSQVIADIRSPQFLEQVKYALPEKESPHRFVRTLATAILERPDLVQADRNSLYAAVFKCAQMNLLPDGREAFINVFNTKVKQDGKDVWIKKATLIPMLDGYVKNVAEYGWSLVADVVYLNDEFDEGSTEKPLFHRRAKVGTDRGKPIAAYALALHGKLGFRQVIMEEAEIERIRATSKQPQGDLWTKWWDRAWKKTVAKQVAKHLPLPAGEKERLTALLEAEDVNGEQAAEMLYGRDDRRGGSSSLPLAAEATGGAAEHVAHPSPQAAPEPVPDEADDGQGQPLEEPSDEELDAMAAGQTIIDVEPEPEATFQTPNGQSKFEGQTIIEVIQSGERGKNYVKWAMGAWQHEPMKTALAEFAEAHPDFMGESE